MGSKPKLVLTYIYIYIYIEREREREREREMFATVISRTAKESKIVAIANLKRA